MDMLQRILEGALEGGLSRLLANLGFAAVVAFVAAAAIFYVRRQFRRRMQRLAQAPVQLVKGASFRAVEAGKNAVGAIQEHAAPMAASAGTALIDAGRVTAEAAVPLAKRGASMVSNGANSAAKVVSPAATEAGKILLGGALLASDAIGDKVGKFVPAMPRAFGGALDAMRSRADKARGETISPENSNDPEPDTNPPSA